MSLCHCVDADVLRWVQQCLTLHGLHEERKLNKQNWVEQKSTNQGSLHPSSYLHSNQSPYIAQICNSAMRSAKGLVHEGAYHKYISFALQPYTAQWYFRATLHWERLLLNAITTAYISLILQIQINPLLSWRWILHLLVLQGHTPNPPLYYPD